MNEDETMLDAALPLHGHSLPRDHAEALAEALRTRLPWLADEPAVGIHPVKIVPGTDASGLLSRRTRLLLRLPRARLADLEALAGCKLSVGGSAVQLGEPKSFALLPHGTLYAPMVSTGSMDEAQFMADVGAELAALGIECQCICGRTRPMQHHGEAVVVYSLMLHGLNPAQSLKVQRAGLGRHRQLGCGVFVPHKSAAAVVA